MAILRLASREAAIQLLATMPSRAAAAEAAAMQAAAQCRWTTKYGLYATGHINWSTSTVNAVGVMQAVIAMYAIQV